MDKNVKGAFTQNVGRVTRDAYSPEGRSLYGPKPSGAYAQGPMPEYFAQREQDDLTAAKIAATLAALGVGGAAVAPELAPGLLPWAGANSMVGATEYADSKDMGRGADMWSNTGLPQRPRR
jgi:hypothetical protein